MWQPGRQGTGYRKWRLAQGRSWDLWLIDYPRGSSIPEHVDPVPGKRHYRLNLRLWGEDVFEGQALGQLGRLTFFRPDVMPHSVRRVGSRRLVLSFGWVRGLAPLQRGSFLSSHSQKVMTAKIGMTTIHPAEAGQASRSATVSSPSCGACPKRAS